MPSHGPGRHQNGVSGPTPWERFCFFAKKTQNTRSSRGAASGGQRRRAGTRPAWGPKYPRVNYFKVPTPRHSSQQITTGHTKNGTPLEDWACASRHNGPQNGTPLEGWALPSRHNGSQNGTPLEDWARPSRHNESQLRTPFETWVSLEAWARPSRHSGSQIGAPLEDWASPSRHNGSQIGTPLEDWARHRVTKRHPFRRFREEEGLPRPLNSGRGNSLPPKLPRQIVPKSAQTAAQCEHITIVVYGHAKSQMRQRSVCMPWRTAFPGTLAESPTKILQPRRPTPHAHPPTPDNLGSEFCD